MKMIHLNFKGMNFQVSIKDIENFEKQNPNLLGINVFTNKGTSNCSFKNKWKRL